MTTADDLTGRTIFRFYSPLALSWLFMAMEGPVCTAVIEHLRRPEINAAGFLILVNVAMWIESPVIDLLSTSTTLAKDYQRYTQLTKFVWVLMGLVTAVHLAITVTPAYWFVTEQILGVKREVAEVARPGMLIMSSWSAFIGWRRYLQGLLIRNGLTRVISGGTGARVIAICIVAGALFWTTQLTGVEIAATSILTAVIVESLFITYVSRPVIHALRLLPPDGGPKLTMRQLAAFHFPMTATTMVNLSMGPIIAAGLARTPSPILMLASFQVAGTILFLHRAMGFCLPEVVIALYKGAESRLALKRFAFAVAVLSSGSVIFLGVTGLDMLLFRKVLGAPQNIALIAHYVFLASAAAPFLDATQAYVRGVLTAHHLTMSRLVAVAVAAVFLLAAIEAGIVLHWPGWVLAGVAITASLSAELLSLVVFWARAQVRPMNSPAAH